MLRINNKKAADNHHIDINTEWWMKVKCEFWKSILRKEETVKKETFYQIQSGLKSNKW